MKNKLVRHYARPFLLDSLGTITATGKWIGEPQYTTVVAIKMSGRDGKKTWFDYAEDFPLDNIVNAGKFIKIKPVNEMDDKVINTDFIINAAKIDFMDCLYRDKDDHGHIEEVIHRFLVPVGHKVHLSDIYHHLDF